MNYLDEAKSLLTESENETLEFKAVLPPPRHVAQLIAGFANSQGGFLILGVSDRTGKIEVVGLSNDFRVNSVVHKAIDLVDPKPETEYGYFSHQGKNLYAIKVAKALVPVVVEGRRYVRIRQNTVLEGDEGLERSTASASEIVDLENAIGRHRVAATSSKRKLLDHYHSLIKIVNDSKRILFPDSIFAKTEVSEGKILMRVLFSSCIDTFEVYLSDLLYEIFLAKPDTLRSDQTVKVKDVLSCADMDEFVAFWAKEKLRQMQRGSVKGFLQDTPLGTFPVIDKPMIDQIDSIFQIRHIYAHRNGVIDEKFLRIFPGMFTLNDVHQLTVAEKVAHMNYLIESVHKIDQEAIYKFQLATI